MLRTPVSTFSTPITEAPAREGRPVLLPFPLLLSKLEATTNNLQKCLDTPLDTEPESLSYLRDAKSKLRESLTAFDNAHDQMQVCLEKQGTTDEQRCYTKERAKYHTRAKSFLLALKWKMYGLGEEEYSDIDGLSDITSVSRMSLSRRNDITRQIEAAVAKREKKKG